MRLMKPKDQFDDDITFLPDLTIYEKENEDTGILNHRGERLYRQKEKIGFKIQRRET